MNGHVRRNHSRFGFYHHPRTVVLHLVESGESAWIAFGFFETKDINFTDWNVTENKPPGGIRSRSNQLPHILLGKRPNICIWNGLALLVKNHTFDHTKVGGCRCLTETGIRGEQK